MRAVGPLAAALLLGGCVAPAPTTGEYEAKAAMTAEAAVSAARTAVVAADTYLDGGLTAPYLETLLVDAEEALGSVTATFDSVQPPPTAEADELRGTLDPLLEDAGSALTDLRIAARRDQRDDMTGSAEELSDTADELDAFGKQHAA